MARGIRGVPRSPSCCRSRQAACPALRNPTMPPCTTPWSRIMDVSRNDNELNDLRRQLPALLPGLAPAALIAEDEAVLRSELRAHLATVWPELRVVAEAANGLEALRALDRHAPQVAFLDIEMPGLGGLEVARQTQGRWHVVFVTAYDAHAVAAFEQGAIDYILKPYDETRLALAVRRVQQRIDTIPAPLDGLLRE